MRRLFFAPHGRSPLERLVRGLLLIGVFALAIVAYRAYFDRLLDQMEARGTIADPGRILSEADRQAVRGEALALRRRFGLELRLRLGGTPPAASPDDPKTVWFYFDPACRGSRVVLPALVASALPAGLPDDLASGHMDAACREGRAREGVLGALGIFGEALGDAADRGKGATHD